MYAILKQISLLPISNGPDSHHFILTCSPVCWIDGQVAIWDHSMKARKSLYLWMKFGGSREATVDIACSRSRRRSFTDGVFLCITPHCTVASICAIVSSFG